MYAGDLSGVPTDHAWPTMPTISAICDGGVRFNRAWSAPTCSPTRATVLTGRYGFRTGIGWALSNKDPGLAQSETTLPEVLTDLGVQHANIGKWHLGHSDEVGGEKAPNDAGWDHFSGLLGGTLSAYEDWERTVDGKTATSTTYATSANVDDAITWLGTVDKKKSWLLWMAFNAPHTPFHLPPAALHDQTDLNGKGIAKNPAPYYRAAVQALDTEIGRLLAWLKANDHDDVHVIFVGDNGSPSQVAEAPWSQEHAKGSLYQGGVHVPLCMSGPAVAKPGRTSDSLAHTVDLFATILALFDGQSASGVDSQSLLPVLAGPEGQGARGWNFTESFGGNKQGGGLHGRTAWDGRYKRIEYEDGSAELYDLDADPHEAKNLLTGTLDAEASAADSALNATLAKLK